MRKKQARSFNRALFGKRLGVLREKADLTQEELARLINRTRVSYNLIEGGKTAPSMDFLGDILNVFSKKGIYASLDYLFGRTDHQNQGGVQNEQAEEIKKLKAELKNCEKIKDLQEQVLEAKSKK